MSINLKLLRLQNQLTLDQLATSVGLTRSYLSKVERGISSPSIAVGLQLAEALGVTVEQLFGNGATSESLSITRASEHGERTAGLISSAIAKGRMSAFILQPARNRLLNPSSRHQGEELVYVLSGSVELQLANRKERLDTGDCAHFDSTVPHKITSLGKQDARLLVVIAPFAESDDPA